MELLKERHVSAGIPRKIPKALVYFKGMVLFCSFSEEQYVSLSVTYISLFDIYTHPNVCAFGPSKAGSDRGGRQKAIDFYIDLTKSIFFISLSLGYMQ